MLEFFNQIQTMRAIYRAWSGPVVVMQGSLLYGESELDKFLERCDSAVEMIGIEGDCLLQ